MATETLIITPKACKPSRVRPVPDRRWPGVARGGHRRVHMDVLVACPAQAESGWVTHLSQPDRCFSHKAPELLVQALDSNYTSGRDAKTGSRPEWMTHRPQLSPVLYRALFRSLPFVVL